MPGPPPKPTAQKKLEGNRGHRRLNDAEPVPVPGAPDLPAWIDDEAKAEWARITPELERAGLLARIDHAVLEAYCQCYSQWKAAELKVQELGPTTTSRRTGYITTSGWFIVAQKRLMELRALADRLGLSFASRSRIHVNKPAEKSEWQEVAAKEGRPVPVESKAK